MAKILSEARIFTTCDVVNLRVILNIWLKRPVDNFSCFRKKYDIIKNMNRFKKLVVLGIIITFILPQFSFAQGNLISESPSYWGIRGNRQAVYEGPFTSVNELFMYYKIEKQVQRVTKGIARGEWITVETLAANLEGIEKAQEKLKELEETTTLNSTPYLKERLVITKYSPLRRKALITTVIKYYWARVEKDIPQTETCLSLLEAYQQAAKAGNQAEVNRIQEEMAKNNCYIEIKNCITTKTATREDVQKYIKSRIGEKMRLIPGLIQGQLQSPWQTITPGQLKIEEEDSCVNQKVYDYNTLIKKFEDIRQWESDCGKGCTRFHQEYKGAYLVGCGCTLSGYKYQEQKSGKGGKAGGKGIGKAILTIALCAIGQYWAAWSWISFGSTGYGFSLFHLGYVWALMPAGQRTVSVDGGSLTLVWCPELNVPTPEVKLISQDCESIKLEIKAEKAETYSVLRNGGTVATDIPASETVFEDEGLTPHTTYEYKVIAKSPLGISPAAKIEVYTKCLPKCSFTASPSQIIKTSKSTLSWACKYADSCSISNDISYSIPASEISSGSKKVGPEKTTTYILTSQNIDGSKSWTAQVKVLSAKYCETHPDAEGCK